VIYYAYRLDSPETPSSSSLEECRSPSSYVLRFALSTCDNNPRSRCTKFFVDPYHKNRWCYPAGVNKCESAARSTSTTEISTEWNSSSVSKPVFDLSEAPVTTEYHQLLSSTQQHISSEAGDNNLQTHKTWGKI
jgi:hypothetical protein